MVLQEKRILCDVKEPDKNHLWLRPRLDRDGYDLLYWGVNGWTPLIDCGDCPYKKPDINPDKPIVDGDILVQVPTKPVEAEGTLYEITSPDYGPTFVQGSPCSCPDTTYKPV